MVSVFKHRQVEPCSQRELLGGVEFVNSGCERLCSMGGDLCHQSFLGVSDETHLILWQSWGQKEPLHI